MINKRLIIGDKVRVKLGEESKKDVIGKVSGEEKGGLIKVSLYDHMLKEEKEVDLDVRILEKIENGDKEEAVEKFIDIMYDMEGEEERSIIENDHENKMELIEELENMLINTRKEIKAPGFPTMSSKGELSEKEEAINILLKHLKEEAKRASFNDIVKIVNHNGGVARYGVVKKAIRRRSETLYEVETIVCDNFDFKTIRLKDNQIEKINKKLDICKYNELKLTIENINRIDREFYSLIASGEALASSIRTIGTHSSKVKEELINTVKILDDELMFLKKSNDDNYDKVLSLIDEIFVL